MSWLPVTTEATLAYKTIRPHNVIAGKAPRVAPIMPPPNEAIIAKRLILINSSPFFDLFH
jgi:hypothetical protein